MKLHVSSCSALALCLLLPPTLLAWTPGTGSPNAVDGFVVDPLNRRDVLAFYHTIYPASENYAANIAWTGSVPGSVPGTTSAAFKNDVRRRINFFRALGGLPADIVFDPVKSAKDQQAALMMSHNEELNHEPPVNWLSYTADGAAAAGASNLALGTFGPGSIDAFMRDSGGGNQVVGHRRWFMYSRALNMGTGDIPGDGTFPRSNATWVIGDFKPAPAPQFVTWPNRGFVPVALSPARWSLSYPGANFAAATVTMTQGGNNVPVTVVSRTDNGFGDNTIVWEPAGLPASVAADTLYNVTVSAISGSGVPTSHNYTVTLFDPNMLGDAVTIAGNATPPTSGATYTFNSIAQADAYELRVSTSAPASFVEGAEDAPTPQITPQTTGSYALRQTAVKRTGAKGFQLAFPDFTSQAFEVARDVIPSATSELRFYDLGRFATTTCTLSAEVSNNGGGTWASVFSRPGVGLNSALWDAAFIPRSFSLAAYAGQTIRVRFILRTNSGSIVISTSANDGFFIDDVSVTNASELVNTTVTPLSGGATSFILNASTAGAPLVGGSSYIMRIRPNVGTRFFGDGPALSVTPQLLSGYAAWVANQYPAVTGGANGDHEFDGLKNGVEYAFGLNPTIPNPATALPQPVRAGNTLSVSFPQPAGVTGVTYGAEWTSNFTVWNPITDTGVGGAHTFSVNTTGLPQVFFRHRIVIAP